MTNRQTKISMAKGIIMKSKNLPEALAHHYLQKEAMDKRVTIESVAVGIIQEGRI